MPEKPMFAMLVSNLAQSIEFYVSRLGFTLEEQQLERDMARVVDYDGETILFAGPGVEDVHAHLSEPRLVFKPGETLAYRETNLESRQEMLRQHGFTDLTIDETSLGDRSISITDPDGFIMQFLMRARHTQEETIALYAQGPYELEAALDGLPEVDLDASLKPDSWSIRQIVHHLAESETLFMMHIKTALAVSGSDYVRPPYDQDVWTAALEFTRRPIEPSLALVKASRGHIAQLLRFVPDNWEKYVITRMSAGEEKGYKTTVEELITTMVRHIREHCDEIREIRRNLAR